MKTIHLILILVLAVAVIVVVTTLSDSSTYSNFTEAAKTPGKEFYIIGKFNCTKPMDGDAIKSANHFSFYLIDEQGVEKKVLYNNTKPRDFEKSEKVVIIGYMKGDDFIARGLLLKCPSKYNDQKYPIKFKEQTYKADS